MVLRSYQQDAHDAVIEHIMGVNTPCLIEAATGAGKSLIIAAIAKTIHNKSKGMSILCLAPSAELITQNRSKYLATGEPASLFSASAGAKCLRHPVVFGTPQTVKNSIDKFGKRFAAIVIDEAHGLTPSVKEIIEKIRALNPRVRVIGLTATPYRMGSGYIYGIDAKNRTVPPEKTNDPYFHKLVYSIKAPYLIEHGYLTAPLIGSIGDAPKYDTINMEVNSRGQFNSDDIDKAYHGQGRKTAGIVADIIGHSRNREGVIIFAATIQHANEVMESLPKELSEIITGKTPKGERDSIIKRFKAKKIKYLVNVAVLTTGFDAPHVDVVALMRATESVGLMQQIIGRGLRLSENKDDCLILDYAENIDRHCPDGDLFSPKVEAKSKKSGSSTIDVHCPDCNTTNVFLARPNPDEFGYSEDGYFLDLAGNKIETEHGYMPSHYGRRCQGFIPSPSFALGVQCGNRWSSKQCPHCEADNDIAARYCTKCKGEIVNPNEKLRLEFKAMKKDPHKIQIDEVLSVTSQNTVSQAGNPCKRIEFVTPYRAFTVWIQSEAKNVRAQRDYAMFMGLKITPSTVTYKKEASGFYRVLAFNEPIQQEPNL